MPTPIQDLLARRFELLQIIQENITLIRWLEGMLSPPQVDDLTPGQIDLYIGELVFYGNRIPEFIFELFEVLYGIEAHGFEELDYELIVELDDIILEVSAILVSLAGVMIREVDPMLEPTTQPDIIINNAVTVEVDMSLDDADGFWNTIGKGISEAVKAPFALLSEIMEELTVEAMGIMFGFVVDYAGAKLSGFVDNAVGE